MRSFASRITGLASGLLLLTAGGLAAQAYDDPNPGGGDGGGDCSGDTVVQVRDDLTFSPRNIEIEVGDTVTWCHEGSMLHNVAEDNGGFRCANGCDEFGGDGDVAAGWSFELQFNEAGTVNYHCESHGAPGGVGMAGTVIVEGSDDGGGGSDSPGDLRFATDTYTV
ncbi:MAG: plastocyanin/azurin family copper-binding protein, partial [Thermoanaerobaculia bacterium]